jgi:hypothetical protein
MPTTDHHPRERRAMTTDFETLHTAFAKGFMTTTSGDGDPRIQISFRTLTEMHAAHSALIDALLPPASSGAGGEHGTCPKCGAAPDERWDCCEVRALTPSPTTPEPRGCPTVGACSCTVTAAERVVVDAAKAWTDGVSRESGLRQIDRLTDALDALDAALAADAQQGE